MPFSPLPFPAHLKADRRDAAGLGGWFSPVLSRGLPVTLRTVTEHFGPSQARPITCSWPCLTWLSCPAPFHPSPDIIRMSSTGWQGALHEFQPFMGALSWSRCPWSSEFLISYCVIQHPMP